MERKKRRTRHCRREKKAELLDVVLDAAEQCGYPKNADYNSGDQEGFGYFQVTQKMVDGWSTAKALRASVKRPNLSLEINAHTLGILTDGSGNRRKV